MNLSLKKAIDKMGGQSAAAKALKCRQSLIHYWLNKSKKGVPAEYCPAIEGLSGIPKEKLRPDVYPSVRQ